MRKRFTSAVTAPVARFLRSANKPVHSAAYWEHLGEKTALSTYSVARNDVPAYLSYLKSAGFDVSSNVSSIEQFKKLPLTTKDSYLRCAAYEDLFPPHALRNATTVSATSGSTGEPFFFPRGPEHDQFYKRSIEQLIRTQWDVGSRSTLCILGFGLGIWIGGIFTYKNFNKLAEEGFPMTIIPVGPHKELYLRSFKKFASQYDQVILMGYPPFIKDVLAAGEDHGIHWADHRIRILTAAEGYSERFRNHLAELSGADPVRDMVNIYGTVEQGTIAHETALANMIRRIASERPDVFQALFPDAQNIPTLAQYYPDHVFFESVDGQIVATGSGSSIPLVRYAFGDLGGVIPFADMQQRLSALGIDLMVEAEKYDISRMISPLPFVYVHARADFVIVFRGANIYPEEVRNALDSKTLAHWITGKFTMMKTEKENLDQSLEIHIELLPHIEEAPEMVKKISKTVIAELRAKNSEFNNNYGNDPVPSTPHIVLHRYGDPEYFGGGGKQRWVQK